VVSFIKLLLNWNCRRDSSALAALLYRTASGTRLMLGIIVFVTSLEEQKIVVTDSMEQSSSQKANSCLASRDISHHLWNLL
jgi:hypothetical protein